MRFGWLVVFGSCALSVVACGGDEKKPPVTAQKVEPTKEEPVKAPETPSLNVSDDIAKICQITKTPDVSQAPKFSYDSDDIDTSDRLVLDKLAECLKTGPLKGRTVQLTGRADPRGEQEYNMSLGARRAKAVSDYIAKHGVAESQLKLTSRGKLDATGTDEATWNKDRRVDISLVN